MTTRGGGQPRRSHTKSRLGCATCKRRHIRCDENEPQCNNCTKHSVRCDYHDSRTKPEPEPEPEMGDLFNIPPEIQKELDIWKQTGQLPMVNPGGLILPRPENYNNTDLRLIYHIASIANQIVQSQQKKNSSWATRIPKFLELAVSYPFVMSALLGMSAAHLSWISDPQGKGSPQLAYEHHGIALNGLREAVGQFSKENADAVVGASILLSWQATDWLSWSHLMQGTSTVMNCMRHWKDESSFGELIDERDLFLPTSPQSIRSYENDQQRLIQVLGALDSLNPFMQGCPVEEKKGLEIMNSFVSNLLNSLPIDTADKQFELFHPFRVWLFCLPISVLKKARHDKKLLVLIAYYYAIALEVEPLFPDIGAHFFGSMALGPIEDIYQCFKQYGEENDLENTETLQEAMRLMDFPFRCAKDFKKRMGWVRRPSQPAAYGLASASGGLVNVPDISISTPPHADQLALLYQFNSLSSGQAFSTQASTYAGSGVDASVLTTFGFGGGSNHLQPSGSYYSLPESENSRPTSSGPPV